MLNQELLEHFILLLIMQRMNVIVLLLSLNLAFDLELFTDLAKCNEQDKHKLKFKIKAMN